MKQLVFCFFLLFLLNAYSYAAIRTDISSENLKLLVHQVNVTDSYRWSSKHSKYVLLDTQVNFKTIVQQTESIVRADIVDEGNVSAVSEDSTRYLSVNPDKVYFESGASKKVTVNATLSEDKKKLSVRFSKAKKDDLLKGMLAVVDIGLTQTDSYKTQSSDYECEIQKSQLICSISYVLKKSLAPEATEPTSASL